MARDEALKRRAGAAVRRLARPAHAGQPCHRRPVPPVRIRFDVVFGAGGTLQETTSNARFQPGQRSVGFSHWARTGRTTYDAAFQAFVQFTGGNYARGVQRVEGEFEMTGREALQAAATVAFRDEGGNLLSSGCVAVAGSRMP